VKAWDVVIIGAGVIGLSLAVELRRLGLSVVLLEKHQPGRESSWAAGGMLVDREAGSNALLRKLAQASAAMFPEFVQRLRDESSVNIELREEGTIRFLDDHEPAPADGTPLTTEDICKLEPELAYAAPAVFLAERCVDPRELVGGLLGSAKHIGVDIASGSEVLEIEVQQSRAVAAKTGKSRYPSNAIVNCAGAWAGQVGPVNLPMIPVKGQMLAVTPMVVKHVVRGSGVYLIPRGTGRLVIGATVEEAGFDKRVVPETIQRLHQAAAMLAPNIGQARILQDWAGLRPGTPDKLPILGKTKVDGYFVATGHYRDGILLAPITAKVMAQMIQGKKTEFDVSEFGAERFSA
jgi:glycine oxidase